MLINNYHTGLIEAGCDEAGRGCLAGAVFAAAVILPPNYVNADLNDSKQLSEKRRYVLRDTIERDAVAWAVGVVTPEEIDEINILNASILAMHRALDQLTTRPEAVIVDGNRFKPYGSLPSVTIVKGDGKFNFIHSSNGKGVTVSSSEEAYYKRRYVGASRVIEPKQCSKPTEKD